MQNTKCKICRKEGQKLFLKGERCYSAKCPMEKRKSTSSGWNTFRKRRRRPSEFAKQLREKQKIKKVYDLNERQFKNYFQAAAKKGLNFLQILELRLDNVVYRLGFAPSRALARQLVFHGHILVDNKKVDIRSYQLKIGQTISLGSKAMKLDVVRKMLANKEYKIPSWLKKKAAVGKIIKLPQRDEIDIEVDERLIKEYYSR